MADSNGDAEIDLTNMELAKFDVHTETFLAKSICKTCCKWAIDDFMKCSNNNLITLLILNIGAEFATHIEKSFTICHCQVDELNCPDIGDIDHVSKDVVLTWQEIIRRGGQPTEADIDMDMDYNHHESNSSDHLDSSTEILKPIIG